MSSSPRAEDIDFDRHGKFLSGYVPHRVFFTYLRCGQCDAYYCPLYYSAEQLRVLYERQAENMADLGGRATNVAELPATGDRGPAHGSAASPVGFVTISVGVASIVPTKGANAQRLVEIADAGLYQAKRCGRNVVVAHSEPVLLQAS